MYKEYIIARGRGNYKRLPGDKDENSEGNCRFCKIIENEEYVVVKTKDMCVMLNQNPYNTGHVMIAPVKHVIDIRKLTDQEIRSMYNIINKMLTIIEKTYRIQGFNVGLNQGNIAGSSYDHLHIQIVPRWTGDAGFMETTTDTKIIKGDTLQDTVRKLKETIKRENIKFD